MEFDVDDEFIFDDFDDCIGDDVVVFFDFFDVILGVFVLCMFFGEDQMVFFVFFLENEGFDLVIDGDDFVGVDVVFD